MKRKQPPSEERRRPLVEINLVDQPKRIDLRRRGCGQLFGAFVVLVAASALALAGAGP